MSSVICTLFEKDYHYGAGALANSVYTAGFRGKIFCGYRGDTPPWATTLERIDERTQLFRAADGLELYFIELDTTMHFTHYKPRFMQDLLDGLASDATKIFYFDPDIVIRCPWWILENWGEDGVGLCRDIGWQFPDRHPQRQGWKKWLAQHTDIELKRPIDFYYSGGFVAVDVRYRHFLETWETIIHAIGKDVGTLEQFSFIERLYEFFLPDQEALNMTTMCTDIPLNETGPEGMAFNLGGPPLLFHAIMGNKPWRGGFFKRAIQEGMPVTRAITTFFKFVDTPITIFHRRHKRKLRKSLKWAKRVTFFFRRFDEHHK